MRNIWKRRILRILAASLYVEHFSDLISSKYAYKIDETLGIQVKGRIFLASCMAVRMLTMSRPNGLMPLVRTE